MRTDAATDTSLRVVLKIKPASLPFEKATHLRTCLVCPLQPMSQGSPLREHLCMSSTSTRLKVARKALLLRTTLLEVVTKRAVVSTHSFQQKGIIMVGEVVTTLKCPKTVAEGTVCRDAQS